MNLGDVVQLVRDMGPSDPTGRVDSDPLLVRDWVVQRYQYILSRWYWSFLQADADFTTAIGVTRYQLGVPNGPLKSDFRWLIGNPYDMTNGVVIYRRPYQWIDAVDPMRTAFGQPQFRALWQRNFIELWPIPTGAFDIHYRYTKMVPDPAVDSDPILLTDPMMLVYGALAEMKRFVAGLQGGNPQLYQLAQADDQVFEKMLDEAQYADQKNWGLPSGVWETDFDAGLWYSQEFIRSHDMWVRGFP